MDKMRLWKLRRYDQLIINGSIYTITFRDFMMKDLKYLGFQYYLTKENDNHEYILNIFVDKKQDINKIVLKTIPHSDVDSLAITFPKEIKYMQEQGFLKHNKEEIVKIEDIDFEIRNID